MRAVVFEHPGKMSVRELPEPQCGPDDVLVRPRVIGICHSDFDLLHGRYFLPVPYPVVPGHEWCAEVVEVGANVTGLSAGDRVVGEAGISLTDHFGFTTNGAGSEYARVPAKVVHKLPDQLDDRQGALVEPFTIAYRAVDLIGGVDASHLVAIIGSGMIGLASLAVVKGCGARAVVVEPVAERREKARRMGADYVIDPRAGSAEEQLADLTGRRGADVVVEASGSAAGVAAMLVLARVGARVASVGINSDGPIPINAGLINTRQLTVWGSNGSPGIWPRALQFMVNAKVDLSPVVTRTYPLDEALQAFAAAEKGGGVIKIHIQVSGGTAGTR
jgi:L-iditol 2-dehydrogenase